MARRRNQIPSTSETNLYFANIMLIAFCVQLPAIFLHSGGKFPSCSFCTLGVSIGWWGGQSRVCFHCSVSKNTVFLKHCFFKQILQSWPFVMLSFLGSMFPQCPHPVASYTFDLTCRYLIKNNKIIKVLFMQVLLLTVAAHSLFKYMSLLT